MLDHPVQAAAEGIPSSRPSTRAVASPDRGRDKPAQSWQMRWMALQGALTRGRHDAGLTQEGLADRLGVARRTIQRWEDGTSDPSSRDLFRWADALGLSIEVREHLAGAPPGR